MPPEHTLASETEIDTETLRYAVDMPGQALSYALGALKILELRERARERLGQRFDVRRFHAAVLEYGSVPLAVLERHVERFIAEESRRWTGSSSERDRGKESILGRTQCGHQGAGVSSFRAGSKLAPRTDRGEGGRQQ